MTGTTDLADVVSEHGRRDGRVDEEQQVEENLPDLEGGPPARAQRHAAAARLAVERKHVHLTKTRGERPSQTAEQRNGRLADRQARRLAREQRVEREARGHGCTTTTTTRNTLLSPHHGSESNAGLSAGSPGK